MAPSGVNMREWEATAKASATAKIVNMFNRPGQLEKIDQIKQRFVRKKGSVEALLKSAMQQQLDGVRTGITQLHLCLDQSVEINANVKKTFSMFSNVTRLYEALNEVRDENMRHSQYVTARENLRHIFTVPESVEKTKQWINEGKLLHTHQCLRDLENSRDDLLFELHKLPNQSPHDKSLLKAYFSEVEVLSNLLEKQLVFVLSRTLNTVRKNPAELVTVLRIIKREERADEIALKQEKQTGFLAPGRPKKWKQMAFNILEKSVQSRIEGTQVEEREDNKHWLIRYLELIRQLILEDLRVVKTLCQPCFPPEYQIVNKYVQMYHRSLSVHLQELIQNGLQGTEYVTILCMVYKTYHSEDMMGHPDLVEHTKDLGNLLPPALLERVISNYLNDIESNYIEWMQNTLKSEKEEWKSAVAPDTNSYTRTAAPIIIFQMINQNLDVANTISQEIALKVLILSVEQVIKFRDSFRDAIIDFKHRYFEDRKQVPFFTQYMIIIINQCLQFVDLGNHLEKQYSGLFASHINENFNRLRGTFLQLRNEACNFLLEELFIDLDQHFEKLFNSQWLVTSELQVSSALETIYATLEDYFQDYNRLAEANYNFIVDQARNTVAKRYLTAMLSRKVSFKTFDDCIKAASQMAKETDRLRTLFSNISSKEHDSNDDEFEVIIMLSEVVKSDDDMISFELHRVVEKYPDITEDHLLRLLNLRGDLSKSDIKDKVAHVDRPKVSHRSSVFKSLVFPKMVINLNF
ncbi:exocyst complex component 3 [Anthonomus grandis grandis]|uniref:exocyst complex component 3 n=1 Tax=Anthonomus grandis grandis TaxID=2921223 RepID=UPI0021662822|nr:exocyst complex component 3 [Anthonomus grandis grandis]XP_050304198.1 exocyst complex component 3 [Anthonomus grandis grandis]